MNCFLFFRNLYIDIRCVVPWRALSAGWLSLQVCSVSSPGAATTCRASSVFAIDPTLLDTDTLASAIQLLSYNITSSMFAAPLLPPAFTPYQSLSDTVATRISRSFEYISDSVSPSRLTQYLPSLRIARDGVVVPMISAMLFASYDVDSSTLELSGPDNGILTKNWLADQIISLPNFKNMVIAQSVYASLQSLADAVTVVSIPSSSFDAQIKLLDSALDTLLLAWNQTKQSGVYFI